MFDGMLGGATVPSSGEEKDLGKEKNDKAEEKEQDLERGMKK